MGPRLFGFVKEFLNAFRSKRVKACPWTISDMLKYKGSEESFKKDQTAALYFTMSDIVHFNQILKNDLILINPVRPEFKS